MITVLVPYPPPYRLSSSFFLSGCPFFFFKLTTFHIMFFMLSDHPCMLSYIVSFIDVLLEMTSLLEHV